MQDNSNSSPISFTIFRHGKVKANFPMFCTSKEFDEYMDYYDKADIYPIGKEYLRSPDEALYISTLRRTRLTAAGLFGEEAAEAATPLEMAVEVPMRSFMDLNIPLPTIIWTMMARIQWFYDSYRQFETKKQTKARAEALIDLLESKQNTDYEKSCSLVSHGFFMLTLHRRLKRRGYKLKGIPRHSDEGYRNLQSFHASRL